MYNLAKRRLLRPPDPRRWRPAQVQLRRLTGSLVFPEWQSTSARQMIESGEFRFLNVTGPRSGRIPWTANGVSRLWLYHLNYCDFLNVDLTRPDDRLLLRAALATALDWCEQNSTGREIGWEPYPLSLRVVNWLKFFTRHAKRVDKLGEAALLNRLLTSLRLQVLSLERRLEKDLLANHLLKNIKALMFAGALLEAPESSRWWAKGGKLLQHELGEQILPDGGHFERSPMYHAQVMEDLLELQTLASACGRPLECSPVLSERLAEMAEFLGRILHPDGEIPLFNDSALGIARPAAVLLSRAGQAGHGSDNGDPEVSVLAETGYAVIRDPGSQSCLIFDCGPLGPDYQLGHGHCDVLSYELSLEGQRVVVDTGVSTYERGSERHYERSTAAHNTLRIDGEEQAEIWASFRVGRRPRTARVEGGAINGFHFVRGRHFGYQHRGVMHSRHIIHSPAGSWVIVDNLSGRGRHQLESFVHFHPAVRVESYGSGSGTGAGMSERRWSIRFANYQYLLITLGAGDIKLIEGWYAPEFGLRQNQIVVHWMWEGELPARMLYTFVPGRANPPVLRQVYDDKAIEIDGTVIPLT